MRVVDFLKRKYTREIQNHKVNFAMDERAAKLYLAFGQNSMDHPDLPLGLRIFDLDFDPVDHLGYRRIRVRGDCFYVVKLDPLAQCVPGGMAICPATGKLFGHYGIVGVGGKVYSRLAEIEQPKASDSVLRAKLSDHKFEAQNASTSVNCRGMMFSKLGHLVIFYAFSPEPHSNKLTFFCSYDTELNLVRCLSFDPIDLISQFVTLGEMNARKMELLRFCLAMMVGRMHKYMLFVFMQSVLAVKWSKNWYTGQRLPPVKLCRVISLKEKAANKRTITRSLRVRLGHPRDRDTTGAMPRSSDGYIGAPCDLMFDTILNRQELSVVL